MPFKSQAQRRKFHELVAQGKLDPNVLKKWELETPSAKLPEHLDKTPAVKLKKRKVWKIKK